MSSIASKVIGVSARLTAVAVLAVQGCGVQDRSTAPEPVASSEISVKVDAASYRAGAAIAVTVVNGGSQPVYAEDQKSDCTVVILQRRTGSGWTALTACGSERATRIVSLAPGEAHRVSINTASANFAEQAVSPGQYRVVVAFRWAQQPEAGEDGRVESAIFTIG